MLQAWFDDSGKEGLPQSPVYLLAGYSARVQVWESFSDEWQEELEREPKLAYIHAKDAYNFKKELGYRSRWAEKWGHMNRDARDERLLRFAAIIVKHLKRVGEGFVWLLRHEDYREFHRIIVSHPDITEPEKELLKNPYYLSFQKVIGAMLRMQAGKATREKVEILFDEGIDDYDKLEKAFNAFLGLLALEPPVYRDLLINKHAEFRDDKDNPALQAADLFAWHMRRFCYESARRRKHNDAVWDALRVDGMSYLHQRYDGEDWIRLLERIRDGRLVLESGKILRIRSKSSR